MSISSILLLFHLFIIPMTLYKDVCLISISKYMLMVEILVYCGLPRKRESSILGTQFLSPSKDPGSDHRSLTYLLQC